MEATASHAPASARTAEAAGDATVTFGFRGTDITIPTALEAWPLDDIRAERYGRAVRILATQPTVKVLQTSKALRTRGDIIELSHRMADACGVTPLPEEPAQPGAFFGAVPTLLGLVDGHADDLEADLRRFYGVDYRQPPPAGPTLRQVWVYVRRIRPDSAIMAARNKGEMPWTRAEVLLAQHIEMWTRKRYPGRPITRVEMERWLEEQRANAATMDKLASRSEYYASGQNMRDAGQDPGPRTPTPVQPPRQRETPAQHALAVAMKNARRTPMRKASDGRAAEPGPGRKPPRRYDPAGSGWG